MKRWQLVSFLSVVMLSLGLANSAKAGIVQFTAMIDGAQANAGLGTGSPATGVGTLSLDTVSGEVTFNITYSGLTGSETAAHVHGAANPNQNAGVIYPVGLGSPKIGSSDPVFLSAGQMADMLNGLHYVNIHSTPHPGGEIRGQVLVPEPGAIALALIGLLALSVRGRRHLGRLR